jgi:hypothetical protein
MSRVNVNENISVVAIDVSEKSCASKHSIKEATEHQSNTES